MVALGLQVFEPGSMLATNSMLVLVVVGSNRMQIGLGLHIEPFLPTLTRSIEYNAVNGIEL